jgi:hypothetical protein
MTSALSMGLFIASSSHQPQRDCYESEPNRDPGQRQPERRCLRPYELPDYQTTGHKVCKLPERVAKSCPLRLVQS